MDRNPRLIPRANWDYTFLDMMKALTTLAGFGVAKAGGEDILGPEPIWTTSGRSSLYAILTSLGLPKGSRVGVPVFCCSTVPDAVLLAGLVPQFIDINPYDFCMSVADLEAKQHLLSAVVAVHMFGNAADMDAILAVCGETPVIEDCAHGLLTRYKGQLTGHLSTASFFSFRSGKYVSVSEGSAIICGDSGLRESINATCDRWEEWTWRQEIRSALSTYAKSALYHRPWYGLFARRVGKKLDKRFNLTARSGFPLRKIARSHQILIQDKLRIMQNRIDVQRAHAFRLLAELPLENLHLPIETEHSVSNYFQFPLRLADQESRDALADYLMKHGIDAAKYLDRSPEGATRAYGYEGDCPNSELCSRTTLTVPIYYTLSDRDLDYIIRTIKAESHCLNPIQS